MKANIKQPSLITGSLLAGAMVLAAGRATAQTIFVGTTGGGDNIMEFTAPNTPGTVVNSSVDYPYNLM